jgi:hypothetical protein
MVEALTSGKHKGHTIHCTNNVPRCEPDLCQVESLNSYIPSSHHTKHDDLSNSYRGTALHSDPPHTDFSLVDSINGHYPLESQHVHASISASRHRSFIRNGNPRVQVPNNGINHKIPYDRSVVNGPGKFGNSRADYRPSMHTGSECGLHTPETPDRYGSTVRQDLPGSFVSPFFQTRAGIDTYFNDTPTALRTIHPSRVSERNHPDYCTVSPTLRYSDQSTCGGAIDQYPTAYSTSYLSHNPYNRESNAYSSSQGYIRQLSRNSQGLSQHADAVLSYKSHPSTQPISRSEDLSKNQPGRSQHSGIPRLPSVMPTVAPFPQRRFPTTGFTRHDGLDCIRGARIGSMHTAQNRSNNGRHSRSMLETEANPSNLFAGMGSRRSVRR